MPNDKLIKDNDTWYYQSNNVVTRLPNDADMQKWNNSMFSRISYTYSEHINITKSVGDDTHLQEFINIDTLKISPILCCISNLHISGDITGSMPYMRPTIYYYISDNINIKLLHLNLYSGADTDLAHNINVSTTDASYFIYISLSKYFFYNGNDNNGFGKYNNNILSWGLNTQRYGTFTIDCTFECDVDIIGTTVA